MDYKANFDMIFPNPSHNQEKHKFWEKERINGSFDPVEKYGNDVVVYRKKFLKHTEILWDDIVPKIEQEYVYGLTNFLYYTDFMPSDTITMNSIERNKVETSDGIIIDTPVGERLPTIVTHTTKFLSDRIKEAVIEAHKETGVKFLHIYNSFIDNSFILDRHNDEMSVLIIAVKGNVEYSFDDETHVLEPGDGIYIPKGTYHKPKIFGARSTFSYCWSYVK